MPQMQLASLRLTAAPSPLRSFRKGATLPMRAFHVSRRWQAAEQRRTDIWNASARRTVLTKANRSPNPYGSGDSEDVGSLVLDLALPALGVIALVSIAGPLIGGLTAFLGLPLVVVAAAAALGLLDGIAGALGTTPLVAAGVVASSTVGILLIPTFLKLGLFMAAGYFVANFLFGVGGPLGPPEPEIDARDVTIDVDATTIDD